MIGTITPGEAAGRAWDVLVAGAGPAGALAARQLARRGRAVLLVEKQDLPRAKVCGACLNRNALAVLQRAGLGDLVFSLGGVPLTGLRLAGWGRAVRLPLPEGRGLSRRALDAALVGAACEAGARLLPRTRATLGTATGKG
ncbi:MAG TPA: FAD-dependent oxidoreductase, partial [Gemmataceae bacterium]